MQFLSSANCHLEFYDLYANLNHQNTGASNLAAFRGKKKQMGECHLLGPAVTHLTLSAP